MPDRITRELALGADVVRLLAEADALGLVDVAIDLDHARLRLEERTIVVRSALGSRISA